LSGDDLVGLLRVLSERQRKAGSKDGTDGSSAFGGEPTGFGELLLGKAGLIQGLG
jgi:hypothetical protein